LKDIKLLNENACDLHELIKVNKLLNEYVKKILMDIINELSNVRNPKMNMLRHLLAICHVNDGIIEALNENLEYIL